MGHRSRTSLDSAASRGRRPSRSRSTAASSGCRSPASPSKAGRSSPSATSPPSGAVETLKSDFVSTVSHELRTPLAAIYGAALTLRREDVPLGEPQRSGLLEVIASESDRLARIVNDILWASRLESGTMQTTIEKCDGVEIARSVVDTAAHYIPPDIKLELEAPRKAPLVAADPGQGAPGPDEPRRQRRQVLAGRRQGHASRSRWKARACASPCSDEGLGVPPAEHRRIFEKFYRLDPDLTRGVGGTGLGLYISRELLERMGGRIWVESSGSGGSTFFAELPVAAASNRRRGRARVGSMGAVVWAEAPRTSGRRRGNGGTRRGRRDLRLTKAQTLAQGDVRAAAQPPRSRPTTSRSASRKCNETARRPSRHERLPRPADRPAGLRPRRSGGGVQ